MSEEKILTKEIAEQFLAGEDPELGAFTAIEGLIFTSKKMQTVIDLVRRIAPTDATVLISGENGTGKEVIAQAIHQNSARCNERLVAINASAIAENLFESELFGHVKGSFTGADADREGAFQYANGGTLFVDEIGDLPMSTQIKLLRVLEENRITRVGDNQSTKVNVRLISATNGPLEEMIEAGTFCEDLYNRLKVVTVELPPLRDRHDDIVPLMDHFRKMFLRRYDKPEAHFTPTVTRRFLSYPWPGNVRELRNFVEIMVVLDTDDKLDVDDLPPELDDFREYTEIEDEAAKCLSKHEGSLGLDGLTSLSDAAAESLAKHWGGLSLDGLTTLSDAAAESLAKHQGWLSLDGLAELSSEAAKELSQHDGKLYLCGLSDLSGAAMDALAMHKAEVALDGLPESQQQEFEEKWIEKLVIRDLAEGGTREAGDQIVRDFTPAMDALLETRNVNDFDILETKCDWVFANDLYLNEPASLAVDDAFDLISRAGGRPIWRGDASTDKNFFFQVYLIGSHREVYERAYCSYPKGRLYDRSHIVIPNPH